MSMTPDNVRSAVRHLRRADPVMRKIIQEIGPCTLRPDSNRFGMLVRSIISQQISVKAARSIRGRLEELVAPAEVTADRLLRMDSDQLRSVGLSPQKARYLLDLARRVNNQTLQLRTIGRQTDERVIEQLTQVTGIGKWTAQMFLIFALGRLNVFPVDDLGIRSAIRNRYGLDNLPDKETSLAVAQPWQPYATVASWYCWRSLDA